MAKLSREDVLKLARLSKLDLTDEQLDKFRGELEAIVGYVDQLQNADVKGLEPTNQVTGLVNVTRKDEIEDYASRADLLKNLPASEDGHIKVNRMIG